MQPVQLPPHPEPGLIEVCQVRRHGAAETGVENNPLIAWAVRDRDRFWLM